jgi:uncharacterized membrane protein YfcA
MYLLIIHNILRLIIAVYLIIAFQKSYSAWKKQTPINNFKKIGLPLTIFMDTQGLVGLLLLIYPQNDLFKVQHLLFMIVTIIFSHLGYSKSKTESDEPEKFKLMTIYFGFAILSILIGMPWWRPLLRL